MLRLISPSMHFFENAKNISSSLSQTYTPKFNVRYYQTIQKVGVISNFQLIFASYKANESWTRAKILKEISLTQQTAGKASQYICDFLEVNKNPIVN